MIMVKNVKCIQKVTKKIMINDKAAEVIEELFGSLKNRYQNKLKESMKGSEIVFDYVSLLYYKCYELWWIICRFS